MYQIEIAENKIFLNEAEISQKDEIVEDRIYVDYCDLFDIFLTSLWHIFDIFLKKN